MSKPAANVILDCNFARSYVVKYGTPPIQAERAINEACEAARRRIGRTFNQELINQASQGWFLSRRPKP